MSPFPERRGMFYYLDTDVNTTSTSTPAATLLINSPNLNYCKSQVVLARRGRPEGR